MIKTGGLIIDPKGKIHDTGDYVSHGEWLRTNQPTYKNVFNSLLKEHPSINDETLDEDTIAEILYELEQQVLREALKEGWIRARLYDDTNELNIQANEKPSPETTLRILKELGLSPKDTGLIIDYADTNWTGSQSQWSDCNLKDVYIKPHLLDAVRRTI